MQCAAATAALPRSTAIAVIGDADRVAPMIVAIDSSSNPSSHIMAILVFFKNVIASPDLLKQLRLINKKASWHGQIYLLFYRAACHQYKLPCPHSIF